MKDRTISRITASGIGAVVLDVAVRVAFCLAYIGSGGYVLRELGAFPDLPPFTWHHLSVAIVCFSPMGFLQEVIADLISARRAASRQRMMQVACIGTAEIALALFAIPFVAAGHDALAVGLTGAAVIAKIARNLARPVRRRAEI